ncbi:MAG: WG repeat-containing protein, partial [Lacibacter sp.]
MKSIILLFLLLCTSLHFLNAQIKGVEGKNGKWGLMDGSGKMITQSIYESMGNFGRFSEGLVAV